MIRRLGLLLLILALASTAVRAEDLRGRPEKGAPKGWLRYVMLEKPGVSVLLPSAPKKVSQKADVGELNSYISTQGRVVFQVMVTVLSTDVDKLPQSQRDAYRKNFTGAFFTSYIASFEKSSGLQMQPGPRQQVTLQGMPGTQQDYTGKVMRGRVVSLLKGNRSVVLALFEPVEQKGNQRTVFFQSFRLLP